MNIAKHLSSRGIDQEVARELEDVAGKLHIDGGELRELVELYQRQNERSIRGQSMNSVFKYDVSVADERDPVIEIAVSGGKSLFS